ncbi:redoxin family protein [Luteolibacter ambystomatis]|uniref:Redoxin family protein n=1 Tax=Luteolibacter ambystomatis TaxID=2824561 RepID=A0A975PGW1_9BACT|nr:redoxin family protein [Luteolibacter ambystomatis]QUE53138.1 redoxin family protein [Luteolibacter ambystomatis]
MKTKLLSLFVAAAALGSNALALTSGDPVEIDAVNRGRKVQGDVPKAWEPGKVYVLECWATWCGPCVAAIPHVDGLYDKYKDKGLRVIGMNVWEDDKGTVEKFVKGKGEGMSYPVVFTGDKGSAFSKKWLIPAKATGIPFAFVVKDGKLLFTTHPANLNDQMIEGLLAGGAKQDEIVKSMSAKKE